MLVAGVLGQTSVLSVASPPTAPDFATLDSVLHQTTETPNVQVHLRPSLAEFCLTASLRVTRSLIVSGHSQRLRLEAGIEVSTSGALLLEDLTVVVSGDIAESRALEIAGFCEFKRVTIDSFHVAVFWVYGRVELNDVAVLGNSAATLIVKSASVFITLLNLTVTNTTTAFLTSDRLASTAVQLVMMQCCFSQNTPMDRPLFELVGISGDISFLACRFEQNEGVLMRIDGNNLSMNWTNSEFLSNNGSLLTGYLGYSTVQLSTCLLAHNSDVAVDFLQFDGDFRLHNSTVTQHQSGGLFGFHSVGAPDLCHVTFSNSTFTHTYLPYYLPIPGVLLVTSCLGFLANVTILNVTMVSLRDYQIDSLVGATRGSLWLSGVNIEDSGSTGYLIGVNIGDLYLRDFEFVNPYTGEGMYVGVSDGSMWVARGFITQGTFYNLGFARLYIYDPIYFGALVSWVSIEDVTIQQSRIDMGIAFALISSHFSIRNITLSSLVIGTAVIASYSQGEVSAMSMQDIAFKMHIFQPGIASELLASDISIVNSQVMSSSRGVMQVSLSTTFVLRHSLFVNITAGAFVRCKQSVFLAENVQITKCRFDLLLNNPLMSKITFANLQVRDTNARLLFITNSNVTFLNSVFLSLHSDSGSMWAFNSYLSFQNVTFTDFCSHTEIGKISENSDLLISKSEFAGLTASENQGWRLSESRLSIRASNFANFNMGLFQGLNSNVSLADSRFQSGRNPAESLRSHWAYGGVLGCVDCPSVFIENLRVSDVSAKRGGAFSIRGQNTKNPLYLQLANSVIVNCKASHGGAIYLVHSHFLISNSYFSENSASSSGGGLEASLNPSHTGLIQNTVFLHNSAAEGGAVKWSYEKVSLANVTFQGNSAFYGPDIASYGVTLSSRLTSLTGNEASGQPINLVFELLDHYGERVNTTLFEFFVLSTTAQVKYRGNQAAALDSGVFFFHDLTVYAAPGSVHTLTGTLNYSQAGVSLALTGSVVVSFRNCTSGEISSEDRCEPCYPGNFSFFPSDSQCSFCPLFAFCPGGNQLNVNPGYWRNGPTSTKLQKCPLPDKCLGGVKSTCLSGYTGPLCSLCDSGMARIRALECKNCLNAALTVLQVLAVVCEIGLFIWAVLRFAVYFPNEQKLFLLKVIINHAQFLSGAGFFRMTYSVHLTRYLQATSYLASLLLLDLPSACFGDKTPEFTKAILASLLLPCLLLLFLAARRLHRVKAAVLVSSSLQFTPFLTLEVVFPLLFCEEEEYSGSYLVVDRSVRCWQDSHLLLVYAVVLPSLLLNLCAPLALALTWGIARPSSFSQYFPLWTCGYQWPLWETWLYVCKALFLSSAIASIGSNPLTQVLYCLSVLIPASIVNVAMAKLAFQCSWYFFISQGLYLVIALTTGLVAFYTVYLPGQSSLEPCIIVLILTLNSAYLLPAVYSLVRWQTVPRETAVQGTPQATDTVLMSTVAPPNSPLQVSSLSLDLKPVEVGK